MNKRKLSQEILGVSILAVIVAAFFFLFVAVMSDSILLSYCAKNDLVLTESMEWSMNSWIRSVSFLASVLIFVVLFLFLVGEKIEQAANELQEKEQAIREEREAFVRGLSHDIRTPLTSILSYTEYMSGKMEISREELDTYFEMMQQKGIQIKELTNRLLDQNIKKQEYIENGKFLMEQLLDEWVSDLEETFLYHIDMEKCPSFSAELDVEDIRRIFDNLASNVKKYADNREPVKFHIYEKNGMLVLEQSNKVKSEREKVESCGLGIENIRRIVKTYHGDVEVDVTEEQYLIRIFLFRIL